MISVIVSTRWYRHEDTRDLPLLQTVEKYDSLKHYWVRGTMFHMNQQLLSTCLQIILKYFCFISAAVWPILGLNSGIIRTVKIWRTPCLLFKTIDYINWWCYISVIVSFKCWTAVMGVLLSAKLLLQTLTDVMNMSCVNINDGYTSILHHTTSTQPTQPTVLEALKTKNILVLFSSKNLLWKLMKKWLCIFSSKYIVAFQLDYIENLLYLPVQYSLYKYMAL